MSPLALPGSGAGRLDLFLMASATPDETKGQADRARLEWLSEEERARLQRFHFAKHRAEYLRGKLLTRAALARHTGDNPAALRFAIGVHGKPSLPGMRRPAFNLSHSEGANLVAVTERGEVGVDIEHIDAQRCSLDFARRHFTPGECLYLLHGPAKELALRFFSLWTLKEALLKAHGAGLSLGLDCFAVLLSCGAIRFGFSPELVAQLRPYGRYWQSGLLSLPGNALAAWFVLLDEPGELSVDCRALALPGRGEPSTAPLAFRVLASGAGAVAAATQETTTEERPPTTIGEDAAYEPA